MEPFGLVVGCIDIIRICQDTLRYITSLRQVSSDVVHFRDDLTSLHDSIQRLSSIAQNDPTVSSNAFQGGITTIHSELADLSDKLAEATPLLEQPCYERQPWMVRRRCELTARLKSASSRVLSRCRLLIQSLAWRQQASRLHCGVVGVSGLPGTGKSSLLRQYLDRTQDSTIYSYFWCNNTRTEAQSIAAMSGRNRCSAALGDVHDERSVADHYQCVAPGHCNIGGIRCDLADYSAWLSWQAGNTAPRDVWDIQFIAFGGSSDLQNEPGSRLRWTKVFDILFPGRSPGTDTNRHFAKRAALCVRGSLQRLTPAQLFAATTTKVKETDPSWIVNMNRPSVSLTDQFIELYSSFLQLDAQGYVRLKDNAPFCEWQKLDWPQETAIHALLARICLKSLQDSQNGVVLRPWHKFRESLERPSENPFQLYARLYWPIHYRQAECTSMELPQLLHELVKVAWFMERSVQEGANGRGMWTAGPETHAEMIEVGFRLCQNNGFDRLGTIYREMGAGQDTKLIDKLFANDISELYSESYISSTLEQLAPMQTNESEGRDAFDLKDWQLVEPLGAEGLS